MLLHFEARKMPSNFFSHSYELVDVIVVGQIGYISIKLAHIRPRLQHVAQYQGEFAVFAVLTAVHEVESYLKRFQIGVVAVVYQGATVDSLFHFQAHGYRLETGHTLGYCGRIHFHIQAQGQTMYGIFNRSLIYKRNRKRGFCTFIIDVFYQRGVAFCLNMADKNRGIATMARPGKQLKLIAAFIQTFRDYFIVCIVDKYFGIPEKLQFLETLFTHGVEILLMGLSYIGHDAHRRLYNRLQGFHLARF